MGRLAIAHASLPGDKTVLAAVLLSACQRYGVDPYVNWRKRIDEDIAGRSARYAAPTVVRLFHPQRLELVVDIEDAAASYGRECGGSGEPLRNGTFNNRRFDK